MAHTVVRVVETMAVAVVMKVGNGADTMVGMEVAGMVGMVVAKMVGMA